MHRDGDRLLQLLIFNEEFLVSACHQRALITSLPFVHTARRSYRLNDPVRPPDCGNAAGSPAAMPREAVQTLSFRGRRSRNKVSVGEPAEGSLPVFPPAPFAYRRRISGPERVLRVALMVACLRLCLRSGGASRRRVGTAFWQPRACSPHVIVEARAPHCAVEGGESRVRPLLSFLSPHSS